MPSEKTETPQGATFSGFIRDLPTQCERTFQGVFSLKIFALLGQQVALTQLNGGKTACILFPHENGKHFFNDGFLAFPRTQGIVQPLFHEENIYQGVLPRTIEWEPTKSVCDFIKERHRFLKLAQSLCPVRHRLPIRNKLFPVLGNTNMVVECLNMFR